MNALEIISTLEAQRASWKLVQARTLTRRQLLAIADVLRARLLNDRRQRQPTIYENAVQELPPLTPVRSDTQMFGAGKPVTVIGPIPQLISSNSGAGFTFVGVAGEEKLDIVTPEGYYYRRYSRQNAKRPCAIWRPATRELFFCEEIRPMFAVRRRIEGVFLHPMEVAHYTAPGQAPKLVRDPYDFEYPLPGALLDPMLKMAAEYEKLTNLLSADLQNDDQPNSQPVMPAGS